MANSVDQDQTAPMGAVCSESTLFASIHNSSVLLGNNLQQMHFFLGALRAKKSTAVLLSVVMCYLFCFIVY